MSPDLPRAAERCSTQHASAVAPSGRCWGFSSPAARRSQAASSLLTVHNKMRASIAHNNPHSRLADYFSLPHAPTADKTPAGQFAAPDAVASPRCKRSALRLCRFLTGSYSRPRLEPALSTRRADYAVDRDYFISSPEVGLNATCNSMPLLSHFLLAGMDTRRIGRDSHRAGRCTRAGAGHMGRMSINGIYSEGPHVPAFNPSSCCSIAAETF